MLLPSLVVTDPKQGIWYKNTLLQKKSDPNLIIYIVISAAPDAPGSSGWRMGEEKGLSLGSSTSGTEQRIDQLVDSRLGTWCLRRRGATSPGQGVRLGLSVLSSRCMCVGAKPDPGDWGEAEQGPHRFQRSGPHRQGGLSS